MADRREAESTFIVAASTLTLGLLLVQYLAWAYLQPTAGDALAAFLGMEVVVSIVYGIGVVFGRQPAINVRVESDGLSFERGDERVRVPFSEVLGTSLISAQTYYGHYARYAETIAFVNRIYPSMLLIDTGGRPVIIGLPPEDLLALEEVVAECIDAAPSSRRVGAA